MNIINIKNVQNISHFGDNFLEIDLDLNNITKILLQLLYYQEHGIKKFILSYQPDSIKLPVTKVLKKLNINKMYKLVKNYDIKIGFKGFPRCIFETSILRPGLRWYFEGKLFFLNHEYTCGDTSHHIEECERCMFNEKCIGVCDSYLDKYGESEFKALVSNKELGDLYREEFEKFTSEELKTIAFKVLDDFVSDHLYMRKKLVFVDSYPKTLDDSSCERFVYYIHNRDDDFEKTYSLIHNLFGETEFLNEIEKYVQNSNQLVISFGLMGDGSIRKSFYFNINDLSKESLEEMFAKSPIEIQIDNLWGIGIDFKDGEVCSRKAYYDYELVKGDQVKQFVSSIPLENKRMTLKFLNSLIKPLSNVLLDYKYKNHQLYSKRIDISLQYNTFRLNQFAILFNINMSKFTDKELLTLSFELIEGKDEKINFYYALQLPEPVDEEAEEYKYSGLNNN